VLGGTQDRFSPRDYKIATNSIQSVIESAQLLLKQAREGRIPRQYVSEQMRVLIHELNASLRMLQLANADESIEPRLTQAARTAERAAETMRKIANSKGGAQWPELARDLAALSEEARRYESIHENP
jgi:hypothetical protein